MATSVARAATQAVAAGRHATSISKRSSRLARPQLLGGGCLQPGGGLGAFQGVHTDSRRQAKAAVVSHCGGGATCMPPRDG